jgi:hypothetical protein
MLTISLQARELDLPLVKDVERQDVLRHFVSSNRVSLFHRRQMGMGQDRIVVQSQVIPE